MPEAKSIQLEVSVWYVQRSRYIKLGVSGGKTISAISNNPASERYHPNLYGKLAKLLRDAGKPAPLPESP